MPNLQRPAAANPPAGDDPDRLIALLSRLLAGSGSDLRDRLRAVPPPLQPGEVIAVLQEAGLVARITVDGIDALARAASRAICRLADGRSLLLETAGDGVWAVVSGDAAGSRTLRAAALQPIFPCEAIVPLQRAREPEPGVERSPPRPGLSLTGTYLRLVAQVLGLTTPICMMLIIDKVVSQGAGNTLIALLGGVALLTVFQYLFLVAQTLHGARESEARALPARRRLLGLLLDSPLAPSWSSIGWDLLAGCQERSRFDVETRPQALADLLFVALLAVLMVAFSPALLAVSLAFVPLYVLVESWGGRRAERHADGSSVLRNRLSIHYFESVAAAELVRSLDLGAHLTARWDDGDAALAGARLRMIVCRRLSVLGVEFLQKLSLMVIMLLGVSAVIAGVMTLGQYIAFNLLSMQLAQPVLRLAAFRRARFDDRLLERNGRQMEQACADTRWPAAGALRPPVAAATLLEVDGVAVAGTAVSFVLRPGFRLGVAGPSGCGKTTLLRALAGLGVPEHGQIRLNGIPVGQLDPAERSRSIRLVPHEPVLFSASIAENIRLGDLAASPSQIMAAAIACGLAPLLEHLPEHLNTLIGPAGRPLSGGERQRIAIARAILSDPRVLLLDEATAALDAAAEAALLIGLQRERPDCAVVIVSHRPSSLARCDQVLQLAESSAVKAPESSTAVPLRSVR